MSALPKQFSLTRVAPQRELHVCPHCADGADPALAPRKHMLELLALIEHPTALPRESALRIAQELLAWAAQEADRNQLEPPVAAEIQMAAVA